MEVLPEVLKFANVIHQCGDNSVFNDYEELNKFTNKNYVLRKFVGYQIYQLSTYGNQV